MRPYFLPHWSIFVESNVSVHAIYLTLGELGIPANSIISPSEMGKIRTQEIESAAVAMNITLSLLRFPDMHLPFIPMPDLITATLPIIRELNTRAVFSFHPQEITSEFDHPDHTVAGQVARHVGAAADVKHFYPNTPAMTSRPELYLWTTQQKCANSTLPITPQIASRRANYLEQHHRSQFSNQDRPNWEKIFDSIATQPDKTKQELYQRVR